MTGLLQYLGETGIGLALFYGLFRLVLKNDTHFHSTRFYLLASLLAAHLLPLVHVTSPFRQVVLPSVPPDGFDAAAGADAGWSWMQGLLWMYGAGAVFVSMRLAWHLRHLLLIVGRRPAARRAGVRVVYIDEECPPFSFFRTAFVHRPAAGDEQTLEQIVAHERTHIRQGHSLDILLIQLAAIGQWFNPFIWLYRRALKELHEYLADREVLAQGFDPFTYRHILLEQHLGARSFELAHHLRESQMKRRLTMMTRRSARWTVCKYLLALPALGVLALAFAEPQVTMARSLTTLEPATAVATAPPSAEPAQSGEKGQQVDRTTDTEKKKQKDAEAAFKEQMKALKADYLATTDPEKKKAIELKMAQLENQFARTQTLDLSDPVAIQKALEQINKKMKLLEAKHRDVVDAAEQHKLQQEMDKLSTKREFLKQKLAQAEGGK